MNASAHFLAAQSDDHPLDLPPVAEADDIAGVAAALGANRSLEAGVVAEPVYQFGSVFQGRSAGDEKEVHAELLKRAPVSGQTTSIVNGPFTMLALVSPVAIGQRVRMERTPKAGGFFLMATILLGFVIGLATGDAMRGVVIGTAIGIAIAVTIWLLDRRRRGR